MRIIFHIDVNNAFLSWTAVELLKNGYDIDIRMIPSVIGGDEAIRHGIVLAKSPIAKKFGIRTAETLYLARKKCPNLQVFPPDFSVYSKQSHNMINYLMQYTPTIEQFSIDECFLDLTDTKYLYDDILKLAYKIKDEIKEIYGFTVNIGIANNKLCAKMASDFLKPDRVHTLFDEEIKNKMWPLPIEDLLYIGRSSSEQLRNLGINTIGDLAKIDENILKKYFKNRAYDMISSAKGIDNSIVSPNIEKNKCISISRTFPEDTTEYTKLKKILLDMSNQVGLRARKDKLYASVIAITIKTAKFHDYSHQKRITNPINNTMDIYKVVLELFDYIMIKEPIRNIGVRLSDLRENKKEQISLFDIKEENSDKIQEIVDDINLKYKNTTIMPAIFYKKD